ncbi:MAG: hypothetical protein KI790_10095 [Cyclobacteriaceae bacterium]|nr:hypothetical protein [Cyclobacteriaceae bacterium HetDA_MAG_MS6]
MSDVNVYLKYENGELLFSNTEDGTYEIVREDTITAKPKQGEVVNWYAKEGIKKLKKIKRCSGDDCFHVKPEKKDKKHWCGTVAPNAAPQSHEKYDIKFEAENGYIVLVDPIVIVDSGGDDDNGDGGD